MNKKMYLSLIVAGTTLTTQLFAGNLHEAEDARLLGAVKGKKDKAYSGKGYVDYVKKSGESIKWRIKSDKAGPHYLAFRYSLGSKGNRPLSLKVNGVTIEDELAFKGTGGWGTWSWVSVKSTLKKGNNTIVLTSIGKSGANVDCLFVGTKKLKPNMLDNTIGAKSLPPTQKKNRKKKSSKGGGAVAVFQAETAKRKGPSVSKAKKGYTGKGYADYNKKSGESITWNIKRKAAGENVIAFRYALGNKNRPLKVQVNGKTVAEELAFENTGGWTTWKWTKVNAVLKPGNNTIVLSSIGKSGGNVDCMAISNQDLDDEQFENKVK